MIFKEVHAILSISRMKKFSFVLTVQIRENVIREFGQKFIFFYIFLRFVGIHQGSAGSSTYSHRLTIGMANYLGKALTTGCNNDPECFTKTELMDMYTLTWSRGPDFPLSVFQT